MPEDILWKPDAGSMSRTAMWRFLAANGFDPLDYASAHAWSVADLGGFWSALWDFCEVPGTKGARAFVPDEGAWMTGARFFPEASLNFAEVMLRGEGDGVALHTVDEAGTMASMTRAALRAEVARVAEGLRATGVVPGDRVAGIMPNTADALVAMLAATSIGAVWTSCSPDFGTTAIVDRIGQVAPKVLFAAARYRYGGREHDLTARLGDVVVPMPSLLRLVVSGPEAGLPGPAAAIAVPWAAFGATANERYERLPFDHPLFILYTSGTTGVPKAIVHRAGGVLLQHMKEHVLHGDVRAGDRVLWHTNTAWMMYHWMVSVLGCGAAPVLYDGAPILKSGGGRLDCRPLWTAAERLAVSHLGVSPKYLATLEAEDYRPAERHDLGSLRALMSAGAPVMPAQFDWVYRHVKRDMMFASISGGTEILGCFLLGSPLRPVRRGQLTVPALGHSLAILDELCSGTNPSGAS